MEVKHLPLRMVVSDSFHQESLSAIGPSGAVGLLDAKVGNGDKSTSRASGLPGTNK